MSWLIGGLVIGVILFFLDRLLFGGQSAREKHKLEQKAAQRRKLEGYLNAHYENDLLPVIKAWLQPLVPPIDDSRQEYSLLSASAYYHPHGKSVISELSEPNHHRENIVKEVIEHLRTGYPEVWGKWISLKEAVNDHLGSVVQKWEKIEEDVKVIAEEQGLAGWDGKGTKPTTDYCSINHLVEATWNDPEYYRTQKRHSWDEYEIHPAGEGFQFGGTWAYSLRREVLEELKKRLTNESNKITEEKKNLEEERSNLESEGEVIKNSLKNIEEDYIRRHIEIRSSCPTCKKWLNELTELDA